MHIEEESIVDTIEFDGFPERRLNDAGVAENGGWVTSNSIDTVKMPDFATRYSAEHKNAATSGDR